MKKIIILLFLFPLLVQSQTRDINYWQPWIGSPLRWQNLSSMNFLIQPVGQNNFLRVSGDVIVAAKVDSLSVTNATNAYQIYGWKNNVKTTWFANIPKLDTASAQFKKSVAAIANDSAATQVLPFAPKFFQVINGSVYPKGGYYVPTVAKGAGITGTVALQAGSTNKAGVIIVTVTASGGINPEDDIAIVSFGGETYTNGPSVSITPEQYFPGIKPKSVGSSGWTLASTFGGTIQPGTFKFQYHVEPL